MIPLEQKEIYFSFMCAVERRALKKERGYYARIAKWLMMVKRKSV